MDTKRSPCPAVLGQSTPLKMGTGSVSYDVPGTSSEPSQPIHIPCRGNLGAISLAPNRQFGNRGLALSPLRMSKDKI